MVEFQGEQLSPAVIKVIGVGGAGGNAVNTMMEADLMGVHFIAVNTDVQDLRKCNALEKIQIGEKLTGGLGAGSNPQVGQQSANVDREKLREVVEDADMIFITAGLGGGTGTGASPVIAELAKDAGVLTVAVVTKPFSFEGGVRAAQAESGVKELRNCVDALITISNQKLLEVVDRKTTVVEAFDIANDVLRQGVQGISDLITGVGYISVDFADVRTVMTESGNALMGIGEASGEDRAQIATQKAMSNPFVEEVSVEGARGVLVNISCGPDLGMHEVDEAMAPIHDAVDPDAVILFGVVIDPQLSNRIRVTVITTGFDSMRRKAGTMSGKESLNMETIMKRRLPRSKPPRTREGPHNTRGNRVSQDDLDIPTFLRTDKPEV